MNADEFLAPETRKARVEIIPLIDVVFFLLATFVLFTLSLQRLRLVESPLAQSTDKPTPPPEENFVAIQTSADGTYFWKRGAQTAAEPIIAAELRPRLEDLRRSTALPRVLVRSDRGATLGAAVLLLDEVRRAGITQVAVETVTTPSG
ncbi:MAG: biopolymer transporter ExbD [Opitutaceae bacterium]|nr:biopolymer transporter ExbD [Opitutaceae bacterium]